MQCMHSGKILSLLLFFLLAPFFVVFFVDTRLDDLENPFTHYEN